MSEPEQEAGREAGTDWIRPRLSRRIGYVSGVVPAGFDGYARLLHPIDGGDEDDHGARRWTEVADMFGTTVHPLVQWHALLKRSRGANDWTLDGAGPDRGNLPPTVLRPLLDVLSRHTGTPEDCWFGVWDGYGGRIDGLSRSDYASTPTSSDQDDADPNAAPTVDSPDLILPGRDYLIGRGPLTGAADITVHWPGEVWIGQQSPNVFWPQDRAWFVASEIDFDSTLIGGSDYLMNELAATPGLEIWPVQPGDSLTIDADHINTPRR